MTIWFKGRLILRERIVEHGLLGVRDGRIVGVWDLESGQAPVPDPASLVEGDYISPGYVDLHVHGGGGADFMDCDPEAVTTITNLHARHGTTALLATTLTAPESLILSAIRAVNAAPQTGARVVGFHIEGPFINPKMKGAQDERYIRLPSADEIDRWMAAGSPAHRWHVTLAPELEGALGVIQHAVGRGAVVSAGHTDATYAQMKTAKEAGLSHLTHLFNAMCGLHHREPGTAGAALVLPDMTVELIADGVHLHPAILDLTVRARERSEVILVTDAMRAAGLGDGRYPLGELLATVKNGVARLGDGALAGSVLTMEAAVRNMVNLVGIPLYHAVAMASVNPARRHGLEREVGSLEPGKRADIAVLDEDLQVRLTMVGGQVCFDGR